MLANLLVQLLTKSRSQEIVDWIVSEYPQDRVVKANYADGVARLQTQSGKEVFLDSGKILKLLRRAKPKVAVPALFVLGRWISQGTELDWEITQIVDPQVQPHLLFRLENGEIKFSQSTEAQAGSVPPSVGLRNRLSDFLGRCLT